MLPRGAEGNSETRVAMPNWGAFPKNLSLLAFSVVVYECPGQHQLIQQAPPTSCFLSSLADWVPGVELENSVPQKLRFQNQILFLCFVFLVDHFQCPVGVERSLKHGLLPLVQNGQGWNFQHFLHSFEKLCSSWTTRSFNLFIPILHSLFELELGYFSPWLLLSLLPSDVSLSFIFLSPKRKWEGWSVGKDESREAIWTPIFSKFVLINFPVSSSTLRTFSL